jgi:uncharacterized membrane protein (UPF0127 family)
MQKLRNLGYHLEIALVAIFVLFAASCASAESPQREEVMPQLKLPREKISFCGNNYVAWKATTNEERVRGLSRFRELKKHEAMIFVFESPEPLNFWMKEVPYDLDIAFFSEKKKLLNVLTMKGVSPMMNERSLPSYKSNGIAKYAVEVQGNTLKSLPKNCALSFN